MRNFLVCSLLAVAGLSSSVGCRMCCPSYDYCEPMGPFGPNDESCGCGSRYGSAFGGYGGNVGGEYYEDGTVIEQGMPVEVAPQAKGQPTRAPQRVVASRKTR